jgi:thymidylate synthase ThyX
MAYEANIALDSVSENEQRLTTFEITFPRIVLAEFNTHRMFSRNSASSRAIPVAKQLRRVLDEPFIPVYWGANKSGMQADVELDELEQTFAKKEWLRQRDYAVLGAVALSGGIQSLNDEAMQRRISRLMSTSGYKGISVPTPVHKQIANRLLEPFMWHTAIVTATDWSNFFALRANPKAQPEIQQVAYLMQDAYSFSSPQLLHNNEWHTPLIQIDEQGLSIEVLKKISVGRCARVSYLTHDGIRDHSKDIELHDQLRTSGHMSPFEHVARPMTSGEREIVLYNGNFKGWHQYRKDIPNEADFSLIE